MKNRFLLLACLAILGFVFYSFSYLESNQATFTEADPITVTIPFDPIRIHRATTDRPRDGKNCGCNECFGLCNAPHGKGMKVSTSYLGVHRVSDKEVTIFFLDQKPSNFEKEFGVDEEFTISVSEKSKVTVKKGEYTAVYEEGVVRDAATGKERKYFGKVSLSTI